MERVTITKRRLFTLVLLLAVVFVGQQTIRACSCARNGTVLEEFEGSKIVIVARVVSVEKTDEQEYVDGVKSTTMIVEKAFKGPLKVGQKMVFAQGGGADCIMTFDESDVDREYLLYLDPPRENPDVWISWNCSRSGPAAFTNDDLLYLNNMAKARGRSRLSGTLSYYQESAVEGTDSVYNRLAGKTIRIVGKDKTINVTTDENGVYEVYDLPAGIYQIETETPTGWKIYSAIPSLLRTTSPPPARESKPEDARKVKPGYSVVVATGRHSSFDFSFKVENTIRGTIQDPNGVALLDVCVHLIPARGKKAQYFYEGDCSDKQGAFEFKDVPPGDYVLVVNEDGKPSSDEPFGTFYYPNVVDRVKAAVITVGEGQTIENLNVRAPSIEETVTVEGTLLYSDGQPVVDESVEFEPEKERANVEGEAHTTTGKDGRFSLKILKGTSGRIKGSMFTFIGEFENCPKLEREIQKGGSTNAILTTDPVAIKGDVNVSEIELKYSFPHCKKAPEK